MNSSIRDLRIVIHTDGCCHGNPGPGGFAYIARTVATDDTGHSEEWGRLQGSASERHTTNNQMELLAVIEALAALTPGNPLPITVISDSQYVILGMTNYLADWKSRGWRKSDKKPVKNLELWKALDAMTAHRNIEWKWVRGHAGDELNETVDALANAAAARAYEGRANG